MISGRLLEREEIKRIWEIDRSEVIDRAYRMVDGVLQLQREHYDVRGWPPGEREAYQPILESCHDHGGWFHGLFDETRLVAVVVLEGRFMGASNDQLQLKFLHVSRDYRGRGLGQRLFRLASGEAVRRGARSLYISATASEHTVNFYLELGCTPVSEPDPELFALEPEDIHLEFALDAG